MKLYKFTTVFTPDRYDKKSYNVSVPALPEICTFGESIEEARFMAQDALELTILSRLEEGEPIPNNKKPTKIEKKSIVEDVLITVVHEVKSAPLTQDVKIAFA